MNNKRKSPKLSGKKQLVAIGLASAIKSYYEAHQRKDARALEKARLDLDREKHSLSVLLQDEEQKRQERLLGELDAARQWSEGNTRNRVQGGRRADTLLPKVPGQDVLQEGPKPAQHAMDVVGNGGGTDASLSSPAPEAALSGDRGEAAWSGERWKQGMTRKRLMVMKGQSAESQIKRLRALHYVADHVIALLSSPDLSAKDKDKTANNAIQRFLSGGEWHAPAQDDIEKLLRAQQVGERYEESLSARIPTITKVAGDLQKQMTPIQKAGGIKAWAAQEVLSEYKQTAKEQGLTLGVEDKEAMSAGLTAFNQHYRDGDFMGAMEALPAIGEYGQTGLDIYKTKLNSLTTRLATVLPALKGVFQQLPPIEKHELTARFIEAEGGLAVKYKGRGLGHVPYLRGIEDVLIEQLFQSKDAGVPAAVETIRANDAMGHLVAELNDKFFVLGDPVGKVSQAMERLYGSITGGVADMAIDSMFGKNLKGLWKDWTTFNTYYGDAISQGNQAEAHKLAADRLKTLNIQLQKTTAHLKNPTESQKQFILRIKMEIAFTKYRQEITGAAFGPKESAEYAKLLPSLKYKKEENLRLISALNDTAIGQLATLVYGTTLGTDLHTAVGGYYGKGIDARGSWTQIQDNVATIFKVLFYNNKVGSETILNKSDPRRPYLRINKNVLSDMVNQNTDKANKAWLANPRAWEKAIEGGNSKAIRMWNWLYNQ